MIGYIMAAIVAVIVLALAASGGAESDQYGVEDPT